MTRFRVISACLLVVLGAAMLYAQEQQRLANIIILDRLEIGAGAGFVMEGSTPNAFEFRMFIDPTEDEAWTLPAASGTAGTQLQTDGVEGHETLSWASAGSLREYKQISGRIDPAEALRVVLQAPIYKFHYRRDVKDAVTTHDYTTEYVGPEGHESPLFMHHEGTILNPVNTAGYTMAAIQAQQAQIEALKAELATLRAR